MSENSQSRPSFTDQQKDLLNSSENNLNLQNLNRNENSEQNRSTENVEAPQKGQCENMVQLDIDPIYEEMMIQKYSSQVWNNVLCLRYDAELTSLHFISKMSQVTSLSIINCLNVIFCNFPNQVKELEVQVYSQENMTLNTKGIEKYNLSKLILSGCEINVYQINQMTTLKHIELSDVSNFEIHLYTNFNQVNTFIIDSIEIHPNKNEMKLSFGHQQISKFIESFKEVSKLIVCHSNFEFLDFPNQIKEIRFSDYLETVKGIEESHLNRLIIESGCRNIDFNKIEYLEYLELNNPKENNDYNLRNQYFDFKYICNLKYLKSLKISNFSVESSNMTTVGFKNLTHLSITNAKYMCDFQLLLLFNSLVEVDLSHNIINDLKPLAQHVNIQTLNLSNCQLKELSVIKFFKFLEYLDVSSNQIIDINGLDNCKQLKYLNLSENRVYKLFDLSINLIQCTLDNNYIFQFGNLLSLPNFDNIWIGRQKEIDDKYFTHPAIYFVPANELKTLLQLKDEMLKQSYQYNKIMLSLDPQNYDPQQYREQMVQNYSSKISGNELLLDDENDVQSLKFIDNFEIVTKLTVKCTSTSRTEELQFLSGTQKLDFLQKVNFKTLPKQIKELSISGYLNIIQGIENNRNLQRLSFESSNLQNINFNLMNGLVYLEMSIMNINDHCNMNNFSNLNDLEYLIMQNIYCTFPEKDSCFKKLKHLTFVNIQHIICEYNYKPILSIVEINFFKYSENLIDVNLSHNQIEDICPLLHHTNIQILNLSYNKIKNVDELNNLKKLANLDLQANIIETISLSCLKLTHLKLQNNILTVLNLCLPELKHCEIRYNQISDINSLEQSQLLDYLNISYNKMQDIQIIKQFKYLQHLDVSHSDIHDISIVQYLPELQHLNASTNKITNIQVLKYCSKLQFLDLNSNLIYEMNTLPKSLVTCLISENYIQYIESIMSHKNYNQEWSINQLEIDKSYIRKVLHINDPHTDEECCALFELHKDFINSLNNNYTSKFYDKIMNYLNPQYRTEQIIKKFKYQVNQNHLKIENDENITSLTFIENFVLVTNITVCNCNYVTFRNFPQNVKELELHSSNKWQSLERIENSHLKTLILSGFLSYNLNGMNELENLEITADTIYSNQFSELKNLKTLKLVGNVVFEDTHFFNTTLQSLEIRGSKIVDLNYFIRLNSLKTLKLSGNYKVVKPLHDCFDHITSLTFANNREEIENPLQNQEFHRQQQYKIQRDYYDDFDDDDDGGPEYYQGNLKQCFKYFFDITFIQNAKNIIELDLSQNVQQHSREYNKSKDFNLEQLKGLNNLQILNISSNSITNIDFLATILNLTQLNLSNNQITNIDVLKYLTKLQFLDLSYNIFEYSYQQYYDIFLNIIKLEDLSIEGNQISFEFEFLKPLVNVVRLNIGGNNFQDLTFISHFTELETLDVSNNYITDISAIQHLPKLSSINVSYNNITDISIINVCKKLKTVVADLNQIMFLEGIQSQNLSVSFLHNQIPLEQFQYFNKNWNLAPQSKYCGKYNFELNVQDMILSQRTIQDQKFYNKQKAVYKCNKILFKIYDTKEKFLRKVTRIRDYVDQIQEISKYKKLLMSIDATFKYLVENLCDNQ
ncbi:leucine-rich_repeat protein [Hexamita inflata]|uniref:Leucine-rich repeat protein n=1 Tax=Hexamita inflata TaxID=28002 RepID=A0AA86QH48_9EUKA|nr:leucine-rich repeat protein [Hexamita inflata]